MPCAAPLVCTKEAAVAGSIGAVALQINCDAVGPARGACCRPILYRAGRYQPLLPCRWYNRTALVVWPKSGRFDMRCKGGLQPAAEGLLKAVQQVGAAACRAHAHVG